MIATECRFGSERTESAESADKREHIGARSLVWMGSGSYQSDSAANLNHILESRSYLIPEK